MPYQKAFDVPIPGANQAIYTGRATLRDLVSHELMQPGWVVRVGLNAHNRGRLDRDVSYDFSTLVADIRFAIGAAEHSLEADVFPGFTLHVVADEIAVTLRNLGGEIVDPALNVRAQVHLARGLCPTTAFRTFGPWLAFSGAVPPFATKFAMYAPTSGAVLGEDATLDFYQTAGGELLHSYDYDALVSMFGGVVLPIPAGASAYRFEDWSSTVARGAFFFGEVM